MQQERVEVVANWPLPRTVKGIQSFLGFAGFYKRFIKHFGIITAPLSETTKGNGKNTIELQPSEVDAFEQLKQCFLEEAMLEHFDPSLPIKLETDASDFAIGAVLSQLLGDRWHPVAYRSRKLVGPEWRYSTPDSEMLAITECFQVWRHYLAYSNHEVVVMTDHLNHSYLANKTKLSSRQVWAMQKLSEFDFRIGMRMVNLDCAVSFKRDFSRWARARRSFKRARHRSLTPRTPKEI